MDKRIWSIITRTIVSVNRKMRPSGRTPVFGDVLILRMYCWAVWHDRPLSWAAGRQNYRRMFQPRSLPSRSQFCRRVKTARFGKLLAQVCEALAQVPQAERLLFIDGKALPVSESTSDPQATTGRGNGRFSRGYKLHALGTQDGRIKAFSVRPLNEHEVPVTEQSLVQHIPPGALVLADGNYDSNNLYKQVHKQGSRLLTPLKGKRAQTARTIREMCSSRRQVHKLWGRKPASCWRTYRRRTQIERIFSALSSFGGGLGPLPNWVRRLDRVTRWVTAKVTIYHARLLARRATA